MATPRETPDPAGAVLWHALPDARWPTRAEAERSLLFSPLAIGPMRTRTRTWVPAMVPWRASEQGDVTERVIAWYRRFARGRPGVLVVEATGIRDVPSGPLLRIGHDRFVSGLRQLVEAVREASGGETRLLIQVIDFLAIRRRPEKEKYFARFLALRDEHRARFPGASDATLRERLAALPDDELRVLLSPSEWRDLAWGHRETVNDTQLPHVAELPRVLPALFAAAAQRAATAGFDGVELHFAHAYTMASFLSRTNMRTDGYGGTNAARVRLPLEVLAAVRAGAGSGFSVGARILGDEVIEGGSRLADASEHAVALSRAGLDYVSVSKGGKFEDSRQPHLGEDAYPYTGPSGHECMPSVRSDARGPFGRNVALSGGVRRALRAHGLTTPVVAAGGIATFELAEAVLANGDADLVASARQTLADPDWFQKVEAGRGAEVRRCKFTHYCEGLDQRHKEVTCQLWDRDERTVPGPRSADGKRWLLPPE